MIVTLALLAAGCAVDDIGFGGRPSFGDGGGYGPSESRSDTAGDELPGTTRPVPDLDRVEDTAAPVIGEVPDDLMAAVLGDASERTGVPVADIQVLRAEFVEWPDGSLGCPEPGMFYTQAIEPGYWVELRAGDRTFDYRITVRGFFKLCESGLGAIPGVPPDAGDHTDDTVGESDTGPPES